ncbi:MAG: 30S ribosomal protein S6 [Patescibacteria group bacterium]
MAEDSKKQLYEIGFLGHPSLLEEEAKDFHQKIKNEAQKLGALIEDEGRIEKIRLSFPIKKQLEAHLGNFKFELEPGKIEEFNSNIKAENKILRFICIKTLRFQQRQISTKPFRQPTEIKPLPNWSAVAPLPKETPAANIEEIDKKLEEILGK